MAVRLGLGAPQKFKIIMPKIKKLYYSWSQLIKDSQILAKKLKSKKFDFVVAIARGGLMPATLIAYLLKIKKVGTISYRHYLKDGVPGKLELVLVSSNDIKNSRVLLIDDKADTGETLLAAIKFLKKRKNKVVSVTLHWDPQSKLKPDYFIHKVKNIWIVYPWEPPYKKGR